MVEYRRETALFGLEELGWPGTGYWVVVKDAGKDKRAVLLTQQGHEPSGFDRTIQRGKHDEFTTEGTTLLVLFVCVCGSP